MLLNAGSPHENLMCEGCILYRAIVNHNFHLQRMYPGENPLDIPVHPTHRLHSCPEHIDPTFKAEVAKLEWIMPNSRNLDFVELDQLISMTPYIVLPSLPSYKEKMTSPGRRILIDAGPNNFYG